MEESVRLNMSQPNPVVVTQEPNPSPTSVPDIESQKPKIQILDHGYVQEIEVWGSDERIIESARMSTNKGFQGWGPIPCEICEEQKKPFVDRTTYYCYEGTICPICKGKGSTTGDEKLLKFLYDHKHMTPFEMCGMTIEVQAPLFVFREWHRHRTQSYNELSARYTELPNLFYIPSVDRLRAAKQSKKNKQGSEAGFTESDTDYIRLILENSYKEARIHYEDLLKMGVSREVARLVIPVAQYSRMRASANLRNWLAFLTLRMDEAAQWEIRQYANEVGKLIEANFPRTWELFNGTK